MDTKLTINLSYTEQVDGHLFCCSLSLVEKNEYSKLHQIEPDQHIELEPSM